MIYPDEIHISKQISGLPKSPRRIGTTAVINLSYSPPVFHESIIQQADDAVKKYGISYLDGRWPTFIADQLSDWCELARWARAAKEAGDERPRWCPVAVWEDL